VFIRPRLLNTWTNSQLAEVKEIFYKARVSEVYIRILSLKPCPVLPPTNSENLYRGADKSLARPGRKQATATEDFDVYISYL